MLAIEDFLGLPSGGLPAPKSRHSTSSTPFLNLRSTPFIRLKSCDLHSSFHAFKHLENDGDWALVLRSLLQPIGHLDHPHNPEVRFMTALSDFLALFLHLKGAVSSAGSEHLVYTEGVGGSSPSPPTKAPISETMRIFYLDMIVRDHGLPQEGPQPDLMLPFPFILDGLRGVSLHHCRSFFPSVFVNAHVN